MMVRWILLLGTWLLAIGGCAAAPVVRVQPSGSAVTSLVEAGDRARRTGDLASAQVAYDHAVEREPTAVWAHVGLQGIMLARGRDLDLRRVYRAHDDAYLRARLEGDLTVRKHLLERAHEPYRTLGLAQMEYDAGDLRAAEKLFKRAVALDPGVASGWIGLGRTQLTARKNGLAFASFTSASTCAPEDPGAWYGLSLSAQRLGRREMAFAAARTALRLAPMQDAIVRRLVLSCQRVPERPRQLLAAESLVEAGEELSAPALLAAADLYDRAGEAERAQAALALARLVGALQAELEAAVPMRDDSDLASFVTRFTRGIDARYRHYRSSGEGESLAELLTWARGLYEQTTHEKLGPPGTVENFPFVGKLVDPTERTDEPLVRRLAEQGLLLVLGQRAGGPPEAMLAAIVRRSGRELIESRGVTVEREAIWIGRRHLSGYTEWAGGGDLAGLALGSVVLIDVHASARWEGSIRRRMARLRPFAAAALAQDALEDIPGDRIDDPAGVADRLLLETEIDLVAEVLVHEDAHLVDAKRFLPVGGNFLRGFGLALQHGFAAEKVVAFLERNAQLAAIAEGPHPRAALAICCASLGGVGVHATGYSEIVQAMVHEIRDTPSRYPGIDRERVIVQQLHRLTDDEIQGLAQTLTKRWDKR